MSLQVAVDLGKTRCRVRIIDAGRALSEVHGAGTPGLAEPGGVAAAVETVSATFARALRAGDATPTVIGSVAIGAAGTAPAPPALAHRRQPACDTAAFSPDVVGCAVAGDGALMLIERRDLPHEPAVLRLRSGPEVLAGSTRLKAGTSQKIAPEHLVHERNDPNRQVVRRQNGRHGRFQRKTAQPSAANSERGDQRRREEAIRLLEECAWHPKVALVMILAGVDAGTARTRLDFPGGRVREALGGTED